METQKKAKLTKVQEQAFERIRATPGGYLRPHERTATGIKWKLMDGSQNPIQAFTPALINNLIEKQYLKREGSTIVLK